jgi:hypothetical protein
MNNGLFFKGSLLIVGVFVFLFFLNGFTYVIPSVVPSIQDVSGPNTPSDSNILMPLIQEIDMNVDSALVDLGPAPTNNDYRCNIIDLPVKIKSGVFMFQNNICGIRYELQNKQSPNFYHEGSGLDKFGPIYRVNFSSECEVLENELSVNQKQSFSTDKLFIDGQGKLYFCDIFGRA